MDSFGDNANDEIDEEEVFCIMFAQSCCNDSLNDCLDRTLCWQTYGIVKVHVITCCMIPLPPSQPCDEHMTAQHKTVLQLSSILPSSSNHLQSCQDVEEEEGEFSDDAEEDMEGEAAEEPVDEGDSSAIEPPAVVEDQPESFPATEIDSDAHLPPTSDSDVEVVMDYYLPPDNQLGLEETNPAWEFNESPPSSGVPSSGWLPALRKAAHLKSEDLDEIKTPSPASATSGRGVLLAESCAACVVLSAANLRLIPLIFDRWTSR